MSGEKRHDSLFKHTFSQLTAAREQLQSQLPEEIARLVRWETLSLEPGSFVDNELAALHTDLLFEAKLSGRGSIYLYLLFEHQSTPEPLMPLRLLRYMLRIWSRWLEQHDEILPLPFLVPMVLYNGERAWTVPLRLSELFPEHNRALFTPFLPDFTYRLLDLCRTPDEDLRGEVLRTLTLAWLKRGHEAGFWHQLPGQLRDSAGSLDDIEVLLHYLVEANPRKVPEDIQRTLAQFAPQTEEWWMTWAEQLREEGRAEERKRAEEEHRRAEEATRRAEEEHRHAKELLAKVRQRTLASLRRRFGALPDEAIRKVEVATEGQLDIIEANLDDARSLDDLLR
jgi:predicted transposase YdaD